MFSICCHPKRYTRLVTLHAVEKASSQSSYYWSFVTYSFYILLLDSFWVLIYTNVQALAIKTCNRVCQWVKDVENEIFLLGASPFSWWYTLLFCNTACTIVLFYLIKSHTYFFPTHFHWHDADLLIVIYQFVKSPFRGWLPQRHCQFVGAVSHVESTNKRKHTDE